MPKNTSSKLKKDKQQMIKTGQSDNTIIKQIDHRELAKQSATYRKHKK